MDLIDQKIKNILKDLHNAHAKSEKFSATKPLDHFEKREPNDIYEMALAYEDEERILLQLELAHSEKYPEAYSAQQVASIKEEIQRLTRRIHAWQNRQFPSQFRE